MPTEYLGVNQNQTQACDRQPLHCTARCTVRVRPWTPAPTSRCSYVRVLATRGTVHGARIPPSGNVAMTCRALSPSDRPLSGMYCLHGAYMSAALHVMYSGVCTYIQEPSQRSKAPDSCTVAENKVSATRYRPGSLYAGLGAASQ